MTAPKNWQRKQEKEAKIRPYLWENHEYLGVVEVRKNRNGPKKWRAYWSVYKVDGNESGKIGKSDNKEELRKKSIEWMRNHPNPQFSL